MATLSTTPYIDVSFRQMLKAVRWCQNALNLRDWTISLEVGNTFPEWVPKDTGGAAYSKPCLSYFSARTWICLDRCRESDFHPVSVLCHEMIHTFLWSYGIQSHDERLINTLEYHLFQTWLSDQKKTRKRLKFKKG